MHVLGPVAAYHSLTTPGRHRRPRRLGAIFTVRPPTATHAFMKLTARPHLPTPRALQQQAVYPSHERKLNQGSNMVKPRVYATNAHTIWSSQNFVLGRASEGGTRNNCGRAQPSSTKPDFACCSAENSSIGFACRSKTLVKSYTYARSTILEQPTHGPIDP